MLPRGDHSGELSAAILEGIHGLMELFERSENVLKLDTNALSIRRIQAAGTLACCHIFGGSVALIIGRLPSCSARACLSRNDAESPWPWPGAFLSPTERVSSVVEAAEAVVQPCAHDVHALADSSVRHVRVAAAGREDEAI